MFKLSFNNIIQPKLSIGQPNDRYEQEADQVADQVLQMDRQQIPTIQRKCDACEEEEIQMKPIQKIATPIVQKQEEEEEEMLQMKGLTPPNVQMKTDQSDIIQMNGPGPRGDVQVHSPVVDEVLTQLGNLHGAIAGRGLYTAEQTLATGVFGTSIDYTRVRIITTGIAAGTTSGNNVSLPTNFNITNQEHAQLLIHELTHVWQYQHFGSGYITTSLLQQLHAGASQGNRNFAYDYTITTGDSFFDFAPEQQAFIVENYFAMQRDQGLIASRPAEVAGDPLQYRSNHLASNGFRSSLSATDRTSEINTELPLHQPLITQMSATAYRSSLQIMQRRQRDLLITTPGQDFMPSTDIGGLPPVQTVNIFEVRF